MSIPISCTIRHISLVSWCVEFQDELRKATDLDQIISVHTKYVNKIHERCLLHKKVAFLKEAVMRVLNLILTFQARWDQGIQEVR
jgi:gamma-tubulin complex component 5